MFYSIKKQINQPELRNNLPSEMIELQSAVTEQIQTGQAIHSPHSLVVKIHSRNKHHI